MNGRCAFVHRAAAASLYDPQSGEVTIDGQDLRKVTQASLREAIGFVMQESVLLSGTVRENLLLARPDASTEQVHEALRNADALEFVLDLPGGLDSELGERGVLLSGGQRQRLAIARVFLKDPPIVILDEATSALDSLSEAKIQTALERLMVGRTSICIAHRLSTIVACDTIYVLAEGKLQAAGTHAELLATSSLYQGLVKGQNVSLEHVA
jgi:ABC-type multidrug transport system fused ATPase/permease subunit